MAHAALGGARCTIDGARCTIGGARCTIGGARLFMIIDVMSFVDISDVTQCGGSIPGIEPGTHR